MRQRTLFQHLWTIFELSSLIFEHNLKTFHFTHDLYYHLFLIVQNPLILYGHLHQVKYFQASGHDELYLSNEDVLVQELSQQHKILQYSRLDIHILLGYKKNLLLSYTL